MPKAKYSFIPSLISLLRLLVALLYFYRGKVPATHKEGIILFTAAISDLFDGAIARKLHVETDIGNLIDTVADKSFVLLLINKLRVNDLLADRLFYMILAQYSLIPVLGFLHKKQFLENPKPTVAAKRAGFFAVSSSLLGVVLGKRTFVKIIMVGVFFLNFWHIGSRIGLLLMNKVLEID